MFFFFFNVFQHTKIFDTGSFSLLNIRDAQMVNELQPFCSEYAFIFYQVLVEVRWFLQLSKSPEIKEVPTFSQETRTFLENIIHEFNENEAYEIKKIKEVTNHDVKAVVHYLKLKCKSHPEVSKALDFFHFGCTSEDIHNLAYSLLVKNALNNVMFPVMHDLCKALYTMGKDNLHMPIPPRIHPQLVSPTTLGKKMAICAFRLDNWAQRMTEVSIFGKFAGVVGKCNDQNIVYPEIVWTQIAEELVTSLGLQYNPYATKIGSHHYMVELLI
ncbi:hypothetical protein LUZ63_014400 [Rhynchospora breviuscula]|uniref:Fumarate lyase N-terminal domain-containing protein n=1 Tax=Rhynchospora breviuscula TaxID=2022672 RepID=A0A9Q0CAL4_9POAL|nr:hypothetical protein LUZ63_014400 [Rhynchospora breviuscula]